jgi:hypothetical protein
MFACVVDDDFLFGGDGFVENAIAFGDFVFPGSFVPFASQGKHSPWRSLHGHDGQIFVAASGIFWGTLHQGFPTPVDARGMGNDCPRWFGESNIFRDGQFVI